MAIERILVAVSGTIVDPDLIRLAGRLAAGRAKVEAVHVIEVRWDQPLDAVLAREVERGEAIIGDAARVAGQIRLELATELLQARDAAAAIVDTAVSRGTDLIVIGMPYRRRLGRIYVGRTVQRVYVAATCAVVAYRQEAPQ